MTLPPPEWSAPAPVLTPKATPIPNGSARRSAVTPVVRAEEAAFRHRVSAAREGDDVALLQRELVAFARWLASRDRCLDEATALAEEALALPVAIATATAASTPTARPFDTSELRRELASWWESLGALTSAAAIMRPLADEPGVDPHDAAQVLVRVGSLWARAGRADEAEKAFSEAMRIAPDDARAAELRGAVAAWGATAELRERVVVAYLEAAARRAAHGEKDGQLDNLVRAFNVAPTSEAAARGLARVYESRGRHVVGDEVWRAHAHALASVDAARTAIVHEGRRVRALAAGDVAAALGACIDARLDSDLDGEGASALDDILARLGLFDMFAARLEVRAERASGEQRARIYEQLGRVLAGPLADAERAAEAHVAALAADPSCVDALVQLRSHASTTGDATLLVEGLIRSLMSASPSTSSSWKQARLTCAHELANVAESALHDVKLQAFAYERVLAFDPSDSAALAWRARNSVRVAKANVELDRARRVAAAATGKERIDALGALADALRGAPSEVVEYSRVLAELIAVDPDEGAWHRLASLVAWRRGDSAEAARLAMARFGSAKSPFEKVEARRTLAAAARAQGDIELATNEVRELLVDAPEARGASSLAWVAAALSGDDATRARAIAQTALGYPPSLRALLLAVAADATARAQLQASTPDEALPGEARRLAEAACDADPSNVRAQSELAQILCGEGAFDKASESRMEAAYAATFPRSQWCRAIASAHESWGEADIAVSWTQRLVSLLPGDRTSIETYLARAMATNDAARLGDAVAWVLTQPLPVDAVAEPFAAALVTLATRDRERGVVVARRTLDVLGPTNGTIRRAMLDVAKQASDSAFAAAVLERLLSTAPPADERRAVLLDLLTLRVEMGDADAVARVLLRACHEGVPAFAVAPHFDSIEGAPLGGDGELARLEVLALLATERADGSASARALRALGAGRWELAVDREGAMDAWISAALVAPTLGFATLGTDLARFGDPGYALDTLVARMDATDNVAHSGALATEAARAALALNDPTRAWDLARTALERAPSAGDALALLERAAVALGREDDVTALYDYVGARALGRYGRRAVHYRAARFYEARGANTLALKHAAKSFAAVPSDGPIFVLLTRVATLAGDVALAVRALEEVSEQASSHRARAGWLLRAATLAEQGDEAGRVRVELLMRAVVASPDLATIALLREAAVALVHAVPEDKDSLELRLRRAATDVASRVEGPDGARTSIALAELLLSVGDGGETALAVVEGALACDGDLDDYTRLVPYAKALASTDEARMFLDRALDDVEKPYSNVGAAALRVLVEIARHRGDEIAQARALIAAAVKSPDDDAIVLEADRVVTALAEPLLDDAFAARVPLERRVTALRNVATQANARGDHADAIDALEYASPIATGDAKLEIEAELRALYEGAGRGTELETRAMREAMNLQNTASVRAQHWADLARRREARRDMRGAVAALYAAAKCEPDTVDRWVVLERVAEASGNVEAQLEALKAIAERTSDGKVAVQKRLAHALEARGDAGLAAEAWRAVLLMDPDDEEADQAIESFIVGEARYADLVEHLARRAERLSAFSGQRERLRALRLRRTAILEQRLGRIDDACDELALLLSEWPDNASALRYLADLHERMGQHGRAAPLWRRVASLEENPEVRAELELRAARASNASGDVDMALMHVRAVLERAPTNRDAMQLRIALARSIGNDRELGDALELSAVHSQDDTSTRSAILVEAAQASARAGDMLLALGRAQRAAAVSPDSAATQLLARGLEYRLRGVGAPADARLTLEELGKIRGGLDPDDEALCAFLLAEALDAVHGGGAGMRELVARRDDLGLHVLIALGIAERLNSMGSYAAAVPMFEKALAGNLFGLRRRGAVAIAAAEAAIRSDQRVAARRFLDEASQDADTRPAAVRKLAQLDGPMSTAAKTEPSPPPSREAIVQTLQETARTGLTLGERTEARLTLSRTHRDAGEDSMAEAVLFDALSEGSVEAGDELIALLEQQVDRTSDVVRVRKLMADLSPGELDGLNDLKAAAVADENTVLARTVDHIVRAFDPGAGPLPPPPLAAQREQPGLLAFLTRTPDSRAFEALGLILEGAGSLFVRDPATYGVTGLERVAPGASTPLGKLYEMARRLLGVPKVPFFVKRTPTTLSYEVALLTQPSIIVSGEPDEDSPELRYLVGCAMAAALPGNALLLALPDAELRGMWRAVLGAFGPPEFGRRMDTPSARVAEQFWHIVPPRTQRRLQELLSTGPAPDAETLRAGAKQVARRVGLFVCGDFEAAVINVLRDVRGSADLADASGPRALARLCAEVPAVSDLLRLASTREYADARFQPPAFAPTKSYSPGPARSTR